MQILFVYLDRTHSTHRTIYACGQTHANDFYIEKTATAEETTEELEKQAKSPICGNRPEINTWNNTADDLESDVYSSSEEDNVDVDWERAGEVSGSESDDDNDEKEHEREFK